MINIYEISKKNVITDNAKRIQLWHRYKLAVLKLKLYELKKSPARTGQK